MRTALEFIQEAHDIMNKSAASSRGFNREASDRVSQLLRMAELARGGTMGDKLSPSIGQLAERAFNERLEESLDDVTRSFFRGASFQQRTVSEQGMRIDPPVAAMFPDSRSRTGIGGHGMVT